MIPVGNGAAFRVWLDMSIANNDVSRIFIAFVVSYSLHIKDAKRTERQ